MKIKQIKPNTGKININLQVTEIGETKNVTAMGREQVVAECTCKDDAGDEIILVLWNDEVEEVEESDFVKITNGYCKEFQGKKQLMAGRFGKLEVRKIEEAVR